MYLDLFVHHVYPKLDKSHIAKDEMQQVSVERYLFAIMLQIRFPAFETESDDSKIYKVTRAPTKNLQNHSVWSVSALCCMGSQGPDS